MSNNALSTLSDQINTYRPHLQLIDKLLLKAPGYALMGIAFLSKGRFAHLTATGNQLMRLRPIIWSAFAIADGTSLGKRVARQWSGEEKLCKNKLDTTLSFAVVAFETVYLGGSGLALFSRTAKLATPLFRTADYLILSMCMLGVAETYRSVTSPVQEAANPTKLRAKGMGAGDGFDCMDNGFEVLCTSLEITGHASEVSCAAGVLSALGKAGGSLCAIWAKSSDSAGNPA